MVKIIAVELLTRLGDEYDYNSIAFLVSKLRLRNNLSQENESIQFKSIYITYFVHRLLIPGDDGF